jgi:phage gp46-like protein
MADIRTVFIDMEHGADYALEGLLLQDDNSLDTAVIISLFTNARASDDDVLPPGATDKQGSWMDSFPDVEGDKIGSRLWLLDRAKLTQETVDKARFYCEEALAWLVTDGVAKAVNVVTEITRWHPLGIIAAKIDIVRPDGNIDRYKFASLWGQS